MSLSSFSKGQSGTSGTTSNPFGLGNSVTSIRTPTRTPLSTPIQTPLCTPTLASLRASLSTPAQTFARTTPRSPAYEECRSPILTTTRGSRSLRPSDSQSPEADRSPFFCPVRSSNGNLTIELEDVNGQFVGVYNGYLYVTDNCCSSSGELALRQFALPEGEFIAEYCLPPDVVRTLDSGELFELGFGPDPKHPENTILYVSTNDDVDELCSYNLHTKEFKRTGIKNVSCTFTIDRENNCLYHRRYSKEMGSVFHKIDLKSMRETILFSYGVSDPEENDEPHFVHGYDFDPINNKIFFGGLHGQVRSFSLSGVIDFHDPMPCEGPVSDKFSGMSRCCTGGFLRVRISGSRDCQYLVLRSIHNSKTLNVVLDGAHLIFFDWKTECIVHYNDFRIEIVEKEVWSDTAI